MLRQNSKTTTEETTADDPRFSIVRTDPRFSRPKRKDVKIPLDSRFRAVFKDKEFIDQGSMVLPFGSKF